MDAEMADVKDHIMDQEENQHLHDENQHQHQHHQVEDDNMGEQEVGIEEHGHGHEHDHDHDQDQDAQQYDQQYDGSYVQQYEGVEEGAENMYEGAAEGEYEQDPNSVSYEVAVDAAAAVASAAAAAAAVPGDQEYEEHHVEDGAQEYTDQQGVDGVQDYGDQQHDGYIDDPNAHHYAEQDLGSQQEELVDDQTLAAHPATSREMEVAESMVVDAEHEVSQAMSRYDYSNNPDGLQTLAATSSAMGGHDALSTPTRSHHQHSLNSPSQMLSDQKPMMPKFNRSRNWSHEETKILLSELDRIVNNNPDDRREAVLRSHGTFEEIAECLRNKGYSNRDGQGCMIRWRNLLRVYKQQRASLAEGNPPSNHPNMQYAASIENIYRFPPDTGSAGTSASANPYHMHSENSPTVDATPRASHSRTWSQANGGVASSYETPARKRARELNNLSEHIDGVDQKLDHALDYISQQNENLRLLEERLGRTEDALKQSVTALETLNTTFVEKDTKRDELEKQLLATVQALSQVIATKKLEDLQQEQQEQQQEQQQE
ncbi:hypothetical protein FB645_000191 [Coemansia sp. IMI 203386]|nr:hypothetical protein FB645_000191 [Coemansia sp. IMI 203386]